MWLIDAAPAAAHGQEDELCANTVLKYRADVHGPKIEAVIQAGSDHVRTACRTLTVWSYPECTWCRYSLLPVHLPIENTIIQVSSATTEAASPAAERRQSALCLVSAIHGSQALQARSSNCSHFSMTLSLFGPRQAGQKYHTFIAHSQGNKAKPARYSAPQNNCQLACCTRGGH